MWRDWDTKKIGELCVVRRGASPRPIDDPSFFSNKGRGWVRISDVSATYKYLEQTEQYLSSKGVSRSVSVEPNDLIMSICATIGKPILLKIPACIHDGFVLFSSLSELIDKEYLFYFLLKNQDEINKRRQTGTQGNLNTTIVSNTEIPLPDINEQKAIAEVLDTVDEAIAATQAMLEKQDKIKDGLLQDLLTRGVDTSGKLRLTYDQAPDLYKSSPMGFIPKEWNAKTINDLAVHVSSGVTPRGGSNVYQKSGIIFVRSQNVYNDGLKLEDVAYISNQIHTEMSSSRILPNDVLLNITGASIGRCCPVPENLGEANVNQHVCAIRLPNATKDDAKFLSMTLSSFVGQSQIARFNAGSNREGLNYQQIRSFDVPWPEPEERNLISEIYESYENQKKISFNELIKLKNLKAGLMQDLLTGKKRVPSAWKEAA